MKKRLTMSCWPILALTLLATAVLPQQLSDRFVIDASKPFAYVKFDHVANRKQPSPNESPKSLWLEFRSESLGIIDRLMFGRSLFFPPPDACLNLRSMHP